MMELKTNVKKWRQAGRPRRAPNIRHEKLKVNETAMRYKEKTAEEVRRAEIDGRLQDGRKLWETLTNIMVKCVKETCGTREKKIASPWLVDREDHLDEMRDNISTLVERRNELQAYRATRARDRELTELREDLKRARKLQKKHLRIWEREWWDSRIEECEQAYYSGDMLRMYRTLREIGAGNNKREQPTTTLTTTDFKKHFEDLSAQRYEREPHEIEAAMLEMKDLRMEESAREANIMVNEMPEEEEIEDALKEVKDSLTGEDGVRISFIKLADPATKQQIVRMDQHMFENGTEEWTPSLKTGLICPIYKKGDRNTGANYRGVCLLAMGSRILARIIAKRMRWWAQKMELLGENQAGFRTGRSTADATQVIMRIQEDVADYKKRRRQKPEIAAEREEQRMEARLLDLEKAYPRENKPCL